MPVNVTENRLEYAEEKGIRTGMLIYILIFAAIYGLLHSYLSEQTFLLPLFIIGLPLIFIFSHFNKKRAGADNVRLWFDGDYLFYDIHKKGQGKLKVSEIGRLSLQRRNNHWPYRFIIFSKDDKDLELLRFSLSCNRNEIEAFSNFFTNGLGNLNLVVFEETPPLTNNDYQKDFVVKGLVRTGPLPASFDGAKKKYTELLSQGKSKKEIEKIMWESGYSGAEIRYALEGEAPEHYKHSYKPTDFTSQKRVRALIYLLPIILLLYMYFVFYPSLMEGRHESDYVCGYSNAARNIYKAIKGNLSEGNMNFVIDDLCIDAAHRVRIYKLTTVNMWDPEYYSLNMEGYDFCFYYRNDSKVREYINLIDWGSDCLNHASFGKGEKEGTYFSVTVDCENKTDVIQCDLGF